MQIANPIYDVVFKYLMEDSKIAKLMISSIIGETIERISFLSQELASEIDQQKGKASKRQRRKSLGLTVYRLDFSARIKTPDGHKNVIIELQKAKFPTDILRFRKYLGLQLSKKENVNRIRVGGRTRKVGTPIISIYFLGHKLDHTQASAIKVSRQYIDLITGEPILTRENFIESLTLDSYVIQIPYLTGRRRTELEVLLGVFDQSDPADDQHHILNFKAEDLPEKFRPIIRKLQKAVLDADIQSKMNLEDGIIDELEDMEREIEDLEGQVEKSELERAKVEQEKAKVEQEKAKAEQENQALKNELEALRKLLGK